MKKNFRSLLFIVSSLLVLSANAQVNLDSLVNQHVQQAKREYVAASFKGLKIINAQSIETAKRNNLVFNITHNFGNIGGTGNGIHTLYGLDNAVDIRFSFDYGITPDLQATVGRSKGIQPYTELYNGALKYRLLKQTTDNKIPVALTLFESAAVSGRVADTTSSSDANFTDFSSRLSYVTQAIVARKFNSSFSLELIGSWDHRNLVKFGDRNDLFSIGAAARYKITTRMSIIADYYYNFFSDYQKNASPAFRNPAAIGIEIETGGHVFTMYFTNAAGIIENSYLPFTQADWSNGAFRFGFNISRDFALGKSKAY